MPHKELEVEQEQQPAIDPVEAREIQEQLRAELVNYTKTIEVQEHLDRVAEEKHGEAHYKGTGMYATPLRDLHKKQSQRRKNATLDPGGNKLKNLKRAKDPRRKESDEQRYARRVAEKTGEDVDIVRAEQDAMRAERAVTRALKAYLINELEYSDSHARRLLKGYTNDEKAEIQCAARNAGYRPESRETDRSESECVSVPEQFSPALPVRNPDLDYWERLEQERDICKADIRAQLQRDTEAFLAAGGSITTMDDWYPADKHCLHIGGTKHIRSTWGYVPNKPVKGRKDDY